jgi:hypothetical protein
MNACGTCCHWHAKPKTPPPPGAVRLSVKEETPRGDCRCMPPAASVQLIRTPAGMQQVATSVYPDLSADFPACGQYRPKLGG